MKQLLFVALLAVASSGAALAETKDAMPMQKDGMAKEAGTMEKGDMQMKPSMAKEETASEAMSMAKEGMAKDAMPMEKAEMSMKPAMAKEEMAKDEMAKGEMAKGEMAKDAKPMQDAQKQ